ncbi:pantetheine-phosphate adenylyltransferase [Ligilactobacillus agilis]|uniref:pantetheine-phosphate adenylyltransferase n=1 Tax=Ligilactobacillus agilis TaxID=1601 RepID=UPI00067E6BF5|nr:pantetheine-phosphate adenylyltransferase [Ligilactobacillus agilis]UNL42887.1 pantetheine-phosphate adenylyltransferase [Ligilactobacillus agilis]UNL58008.1 pantetheine-phosphate adenylyltransferase [Ligilactobacillus agilis]
MKAVFPGSFDPLTNGHLDLIKRASGLFEEVIVAIATNTAKQPLFSPQEKMTLVNSAIKDLPNVSAVAIPSDLTVNVARKLGAKAIVRGVRNVQDFEYEQGIAAMNKQLAPDLETILLFARPEYTLLSSSLIKEVARFHGDLAKFVPVEVGLALKKKMESDD